MTHQNWYTYIFMFLFATAMLGFYICSYYKLTHRMVYAGTLMMLWAVLIAWNWV